MYISFIIFISLFFQKTFLNNISFIVVQYNFLYIKANTIKLTQSNQNEFDA